jgi:DNA-binding MarR family transcriptional regulator
MSASPAECAGQILETVPLVMRTIRNEMRLHRGSDLSVPQLRVLVYLNRHEGASLSDIAEHIGSTLPSMSKMVDGLVTRGLVSRSMDPTDRRRVVLAPTALGRTTRQAAHKATESRLAERLAALSVSERNTIVEAMQALKSIFASGREATTTIGK